MREVLWHLPEGSITSNAQDISPWYEFENYWFKITAGYPSELSNSSNFISKKIHENTHMYNTFTVVSTQNVRIYVVSGCQNKLRLIELAAARTHSWPRPVFCLLLEVSSNYAQPITGQVTEVTCPVIRGAQPELAQSKGQKAGPGHVTSFKTTDEISRALAALR